MPVTDQQNADNISRAIGNCTQILVLLTEVIAGTTLGQAPTATQIQAVVNGAASSGVPTPKPTYTLDGETWNWTEYQTLIIDKLEQLRKLEIIFRGPFEVISRGTY